MVPLMAVFEFGPGFYSDPGFVGFYAALICFGMVVKVPTYAFRTLIIRKEYLVYALLLVGLFAAAIPAYGWRVLILASLIYAASIPVSFLRYYQLRKTL